MNSLISIRDLSKQDIDSLIADAIRIKSGQDIENLSKIRLANLFFEDSTRTRGSFGAAALHLEMIVREMAGAAGSSVKKNEPITHTARMYLGAQRCEGIVIRHNLVGAPRLLADHYKEIPVINAGDGNGGHPTQTLLDLMTMQEKFGSLEGLRIGMVGDLKYGRTVHSLLQAAEIFNMDIRFVSPDSLEMPEWRTFDYQNATGKAPIINPDLIDAIKNVDVLYMTRIQKERFVKDKDDKEGLREFQKVSKQYQLTAEMLKHADKNLIVLHPLPIDKEVMEITYDVEKTPHAWYFKQSDNGTPMRAAILMKAFSNEEFEGRKKEHPTYEGLWRDLPINSDKEQKEGPHYKPLENGTLIDHIPPLLGDLVKEVLGLKGKRGSKIIAEDIPSKKYDRKDVFMIRDVELLPDQLSKLGLVSPNATVNIIHNNRVTRKGRVNLPYELEGMIECQTPNCVSRPEYLENAPSKFYVEKRDPTLTVRCHYCETPVINRGQIILI